VFHTCVCDAVELGHRKYHEPDIKSVEVLCIVLTNIVVKRVCVFKPNENDFILIQDCSQDSDCCQVLHYSSFIPLFLSPLVMMFHFLPHWIFTRFPQDIILLSFPSLSSRSAAFLAVGSPYPHNGSNSLSKGNTVCLMLYLSIFHSSVVYSSS